MAFINEKRFDDQLKKISDLYEEGKDCLGELDPVSIRDENFKASERLYEILRELRDIACVNLKTIHITNDNN